MITGQLALHKVAESEVGAERPALYLAGSLGLENVSRKERVRKASGCVM